MSQTRTEELETLFEYAPADSIQKSLRVLLFCYLMSAKKDMIPVDFDSVVSDLYYLTDFIQKEGDRPKG